MEDKDLAGMGAMPKVYEVGYLILPIVAEADLGAKVTGIRDIIEGAGGKMISDEYPKHIELAYPIPHMVNNKRTLHHSAYFGWMKFDGEPKSAKSISDAFKKDEHILRFLLIKTLRENTMAPKKIFRELRANDPKPDEKAVEKPALSEEELDKTIEELVIS
jgi:ribosomal protein S6